MKERKRSWKSTLSRKKREQRRRGEAKERYTFLNKIFPYKCVKEGNFFSASKRDEKEEHKHFAIIAHNNNNIFTYNII